MKTFILITILFLCIGNSYAQFAHGNTPIHKGNKWIFQGYDVSKTIVVYEIMDSTVVIDSVEYYLYHNTNGYSYWPIRFREDGFYVEKKDTSYNAPFNEMIFYKKGALPGDSWIQMYPGEGIHSAIITDTFRINIFDTAVVARDIYIDLGLNVYYELWTDEFGLIADADFWGPTSYLKGCIINGRVYGDTVTTNIQEEQEINYIPKNFILYTNYPNPFNPATTIHYHLFKSAYIELSIYNMSGQKLALLVSKRQSAGDYKYNWNADNLSSGVYLICISVGNKTQLQKAVLIR